MLLKLLISPINLETPTSGQEQNPSAYYCYRMLINGIGTIKTGKTSCHRKTTGRQFDGRVVTQECLSHYLAFDNFKLDLLVNTGARSEKNFELWIDKTFRQWKLASL